MPGGNIVKVGADFLGVHVLGVFVAAIGRQHIRPDLVYRQQVSCAVTSDNEKQRQNPKRT